MVETALIAFVVVVAVILTSAVVYGLGYAWSKGFHRAKREFVNRVVRENCDNG